MADPASEQSSRVDYRFLLANERTFLAWQRTALALQVAGLGVLQFLTHGHGVVRYTLGLGLVLVGSFVGVSGYRRYVLNERAIRSGAELERARTSMVMVVVVATLPVLAALVLTLAAVL